jgi:hypothetical protein
MLASHLSNIKENWNEQKNISNEEKASGKEKKTCSLVYHCEKSETHTTD